jgi:hypothetical protein
MDNRGRNGPYSGAIVGFLIGIVVTVVLDAAVDDIVCSVLVVAEDDSERPLFDIGTVLPERVFVPLRVALPAPPVTT